MNPPDLLTDLFQATFGFKAEQVQRIKSHASKRIMFRLRAGNGTSVIGVYNPDIAENRAYLEFGRAFLALKLPVPEIYAQDKTYGFYLVQDLGDETLLDHLQTSRGQSSEVPAETQKLYRQAVEQLLRFQTETIPKLDLSLCYQGKLFDQKAMLADMHYFQENLLQALQVVFDPVSLENDFVAFAAILSKAKADFFMYRDFQARNIMLKEQRLYFIDYQSGRLGPLQYDLASLLFQSGAQLPQNLREDLLDVYLKALPKSAKVSEAEFRDYFEPMALLRAMQALGAYAKVGLRDGKESFKKNIPVGLKTLQEILQLPGADLLPPYLKGILQETASKNI